MEERMELVLDVLPEDCIAHILAFTSPREACSSSLVSLAFHAAAESDLLWDCFLPSDYPQLLSRLVSPLIFHSKKDLFRLLATPLLIDDGKKIVSIDKRSGKKCFMLSARELSITWSTNPLYWCWKPLAQSRFSEVVELILICWLEIRGTMSTRMLSPNTTYGVYLIVKVVDRAHGLDSIPSEVFVEVGNHMSQGTIYLRPRESRKQNLEGIFMQNRIQTLRSWVSRGEDEERVPHERKDGWLEIELGNFYNDGSDGEVKMCLRETKGEHLKGGLIVEGIELRPKN